MRLSSRRLRRSVLPVRNPHGTIGTAAVVAPGLALTALHVTTPGDPGALCLGHTYPVTSVATLPLTGYGDAHEQARRSQHRAQHLVWGDTADALNTVDLALLAVPGLHNQALPLRADPVYVGEHLIVPGYPGGHWSINQGPVTGTDDADFALQVLLGPSASGAPALDHDNHLAGVVTLDHQNATLCIGPRLLITFLHRLLATVG